MRLLIDNNDGAGEVDYSRAVRSDRGVMVRRARGEWTVCEAGLCVTATGVPLPQDRARVRVVDEGGAEMFRGFAESAARASEEGTTTAEADDFLLLRAVEEAWLTQAQPDVPLQPVTAVAHHARLCDVAIHMDSAAGPMEDLALDVTLSGEMEAAEYVTELFRGDGSTQTFLLQHGPFRESGSGTLLDDSFDGREFNAANWDRLDTGTFLSLGSGGLRVGGGTGFDGGTVLRWTKAIETGGSLVAEMSGVRLGAGSDGVLAGFYDATVAAAQCIAGIRVRGSADAHVAVAIVNGVEGATAFALDSTHTYTLRVRLHCVELQRIRERYTALVDGVVQQFGGDSVDAPLRVVMEAVDEGLASSTLPTVLYDGAMAVSPLMAVFAPVNSASLLGSVGRVRLMQTGSCLVTTVASDGTTRTRRQGEAGSGADYAVSSTGTVTFTAGLLPQAGDLVLVQYRRGRRSCAWQQDDTAAYVRASLGLPGLPSWSGRVLAPPARSSQDCRAAAMALLALATGSATGQGGSASWVRGGDLSADVSPGDTLMLTSQTGSQVLPVTAVQARDENCVPEKAVYTASFRQSRSSNLDFHVQTGVAVDTTLPVQAAPPNGLPENLQGLQVTVATASSLQMDAGVDAPDGWGFEVRASDANFGSTSAVDLVLRSPVRSFSVPRAAFRERFFVRMYDNSSPPKYSAVSSVVLTSLPVS